MKAFEAADRLQAIARKFGDLPVVGGSMTDDTPLTRISVVDSEGMEVYPRDPNGVAGRNPVAGIFLE